MWGFTIDLKITQYVDVNVSHRRLLCSALHAASYIHILVCS